MPSFYPRVVHGLPTPPEIMDRLRSGDCEIAQSQQVSLGLPVRGNHNSTYDTTDRRSQHQPGVYQPVASYSNDYARQYLTGAPILPPMRVYDPCADVAAVQQQQVQPIYRQEQRSQQPKEEKQVGGVSATLDYDMERMVDFVSEMAQGIVQPGLAVPQSFRKWVSQVLCATRLPSATILLSLSYLSVRMTMLSAGGRFRASEGQTYRLLTMALVLGSKFLDDNTFINRSWSEVSGIKVAELNNLEMEWLTAISFNLHRDPSEQQGFNSWLVHWQQYDARAVAKQKMASMLRPIDTSTLRQPSPIVSSSPYDQMYHSPSVREISVTDRNGNLVANYNRDVWSNRRGISDESPVAATYNMPLTPEYSAGSGPWNSEGYSRRTMFGFPPMQQPILPMRPVPHTLPSYQQHYSPSGWNGHGRRCSCVYCQPAPYAVVPSHGLQPVMG